MIFNTQNTLNFSNKIISFEFMVKEVIPFKEIYLVLFDPSSNKKKWGVFPNLYAFDKQGNQLWIAELSIYGSYYKIEVTGGRIVAIAPSCDCLINPQNGKIMEEIFTK